jgi:hypothetical protein
LTEVTPTSPADTSDVRLARLQLVVAGRLAGKAANRTSFSSLQGCCTLSIAVLSCGLDTSSSRLCGYQFTNHHNAAKRSFAPCAAVHGSTNFALSCRVSTHDSLVAMDDSIWISCVEAARIFVDKRGQTNTVCHHAPDHHR